MGELSTIITFFIYLPNLVKSLTKALFTRVQCSLNSLQEHKSLESSILTKGSAYLERLAYEDDVRKIIKLLIGPSNDIDQKAEK